MPMDFLEFANKIGCKELHITIDPESGLKGIVAIHSVKLGPALGGCRFLHYTSTNLAATDAIRLAQAMAFKAAISNLPLGGGKAVLLLPEDLTNFNRPKALKAFGKFLNTLNGRYITAVDSGTNVTDMDHIATQTSFVTSTSKFSYSIPDPSVITARGVLHGILAAVKAKFSQNDLQGLHVAIQGVGNVGYNLVKLLDKLGVKLSICDTNKNLINRCLSEFKNINIIEDPEKIYTVNADIFAPCALGGILNEKTIEQLTAKIIAGAANNQLASSINAEHLHQKGILYAPDFTINAGGLIYVAGPVIGQTEQENLQKVDNIYNTLLKIFQLSAMQNINTNNIAYDLASEKLMENNLCPA